MAGQLRRADLGVPRCPSRDPVQLVPLRECAEREEGDSACAGVRRLASGRTSDHRRRRRLHHHRPSDRRRTTIRRQRFPGPSARHDGHADAVGAATSARSRGSLKTQTNRHQDPNLMVPPIGARMPMQRPARTVSNQEYPDRPASHWLRQGLDDNQRQTADTQRPRFQANHRYTSRPRRDPAGREDNREGDRVMLFFVGRR